ncbi:type II toxin-antitoxin system RelE/ParE family toxin [Solimicrobium silvestre]|uniref:type II toxin-antitoxin system RelE/ParE family toxin n=1 Tax=Solimicrobium silvestre TaxID=2099400 RepID=UPI000DD5EE6E
MQIKWTKRASQNFDSILSHIATSNPMAFKKFMLDTLEKIANLRDFPLYGRAGIVPLSRELVIQYCLLPNKNRTDRNITCSSCPSKVSLIS